MESLAAEEALAARMGRRRVQALRATLEAVLADGNPGFPPRGPSGRRTHHDGRVSELRG
jgi:hypothetical protein